MEFLDGQIKNMVDYAIKTYPLLYMVDTYENSFCRVLEHIFFVNGNGFDFGPEGYPFEDPKKFYKEDTSDLFDKKIWWIDFMSYGINNFFELMEKNGINKSDFEKNRYNHSGKYIWFFANVDFIKKVKKIINKYKKDFEKETENFADKDKFDNLMKFYNTVNVLNSRSKEAEHYYPLCHYSKLCEMKDGFYEPTSETFTKCYFNDETKFYAKIIVERAIKYYTKTKNETVEHKKEELKKLNEIKKFLDKE